MWNMKINSNSNSNISDHEIEEVYTLYTMKCVVKESSVRDEKKNRPVPSTPSLLSKQTQSRGQKLPSPPLGFVKSTGQREDNVPCLSALLPLQAYLQTDWGPLVLFLMSILRYNSLGNKLLKWKPNIIFTRSEVLYFVLNNKKNEINGSKEGFSFWNLHDTSRCVMM